MSESSYKAQDCTRLATVSGFPIYENPEYGDEAPVLIVIDGRLVESCFWDVPNAHELADAIGDLRTR